MQPFPLLLQLCFLLSFFFIPCFLILTPAAPSPWTHHLHALFLLSFSSHVHCALPRQASLSPSSIPSPSHCCVIFVIASTARGILVLCLSVYCPSSPLTAVRHLLRLQSVPFNTGAPAPRHSEHTLNEWMSLLVWQRWLISHWLVNASPHVELERRTQMWGWVWARSAAQDELLPFPLRTWQVFPGQVSEWMWAQRSPCLQWCLPAYSETEKSWVCYFPYWFHLASR